MEAVSSDMMQANIKLCERVAASAYGSSLMFVSGEAVVVLVAVCCTGCVSKQAAAPASTAVNLSTHCPVQSEDSGIDANSRTNDNTA